MYKHTGSKWHLDGYEVLNEKDGFLIAEVTEFSEIDESKSNASLIAAAPELLEALQNIKRRMYEPRRFWLQEAEWIVDKAIAKATGES